ncbi:hypothetical protein RUM44_000239 [Polyplax serrata]|uniref:Proline-rich transmembrane protein 3/4 domain-containing protein n=1 Tax=Polyplax serrata TaxID=468196 RepID=A0ABR1B4V8_POLSC
MDLTGSSLSSASINPDESSTLKAALFNSERILSTEPTIFHYPSTVIGGADSGGWVRKRKAVPTSSTPVESTPEKPPSFLNQIPAKHVAYRDVSNSHYPSSSPRYPPQIPSYAPPSRTGFFTPPLPPEYLNPFAGKPTLRGSNSESNNNNARRPVPPPPLFRHQYESKERVPFPPPDFMVPELKPSGKKALNTPSRPSSHHIPESAYKEVPVHPEVNNGNSNSNKDVSGQTSVRQMNDTDFDFVPILHYPSLTRILSGSSGRKHDSPDLGDRYSGPNSRHGHHNYEHMSKSLPNLRKDFNFVPNYPREETPKPQDTFKTPEKAEASASASQATASPPSSISTSAPVTVPTTTTAAAAAVMPAAPNRTQDMTDDLGVAKHPEGDTKTVETEESDMSNVAEAYNPYDRQHPTMDGDVYDSESHQVNDKNSLYLWVVAWDIHVYLIASLFTLLFVYAVYNLILMKFYKHLLSRPYYISIHVIIALIGILRAVYLFHDAYNTTRSYPEPISHLLLNITCPLLTTAFAIMFLYLIKTADVSPFNTSFLKHPICLILMSLTHLALCVCLDVTSDLTFDVSGMKYLPLVCQCIYILFCIILGGSYLYIYKTLANAASRKQVEMFGSLYTTTSEMHKNRPAALCLAIRITLAVAMLVLLMAAVQVYGIFGVPVGLHDSYSFLDPQNQNMQRWVWWAYHFSVRLIEIAICYLLSWAAMQRLNNEVDEKETNSQNSTTGLALFPCGPCRNAEENIDDIYPAVCNTNQAIHNYSLRTGKRVYDDSFPLNNITGDMAKTPIPTFENPDHVNNSYDRRKSKRHNGNLPWHLSQNQSNNYDEIGPGSEIIEIKDALTRKGLSSLNRSDSDASRNSHIPAHVSYESIGYHSGNFQARHMGVENGHFDYDKDTISENGSNLSKADSRCFESDAYDSNRGSFTVGHKKLHRSHDHRGSHGMKKSGTLMAFPPGEKRRMTSREGVQTLREGRDRVERQSPSSMLVDENGFVRFRSLADAERISEENSRRSGHGKKSLPRRSGNEDRIPR